MSNEEFKHVNVSESGQAVVVSGWSGNRPPKLPCSGEVSATHFSEGKWYINRAIVGPGNMRGKGLGSALLKRLLAEVSAKPGFQEIIVEPGGYHNDLAKQVRFYTKNGFTAVPDALNRYRWTKEARRAQAS